MDGQDSCVQFQNGQGWHDTDMACPKGLQSTKNWIRYILHIYHILYSCTLLQKNALNTKRMVPLYVWLFNTTHTDSQIDKHSHPRYYGRSSNPTSDSKICYPRASSNLKKHSMTVSSVMIKIIHKQQVCTTSYNCFSWDFQGDK